MGLIVIARSINEKLEAARHRHFVQVASGGLVTMTKTKKFELYKDKLRSLSTNSIVRVLTFALGARDTHNRGHDDQGLE